MQMPARTPAMTAMTAMSLDHLSGGRFILGLGPSGPQVVEGWHGVPYGRRSRARANTSRSCARSWRAKEPLEYEGLHYQIPTAGPETTGLGKPLKSILHGEPGHADLHRVDRSGGPALRRPRWPTASSR